MQDTHHDLISALGVLHFLNMLGEDLHKFEVPLGDVGVNNRAEVTIHLYKQLV